MKRFNFGIMILLILLSAFATSSFAQSEGTELAKASYGVKIVVDLSDQRMNVYEHGKHKYAFPVSTGRAGHRTSKGSFRITRMYRKYTSREYGSPMPHSMFFEDSRGLAIHGTYSTRYLGRPVSAGCVRLSPRNARRLYNLVAMNGRSSARVIVKR